MSRNNLMLMGFLIWIMLAVGAFFLLRGPDYSRVEFTARSTPPSAATANAGGLSLHEGQAMVLRVQVLDRDEFPHPPTRVRYESSDSSVFTLSSVDGEESRDQVAILSHVSGRASLLIFVGGERVDALPVAVLAQR